MLNALLRIFAMSIITPKRKVLRMSVQDCFFFFQAEDGIRDWSVTGVQTCALPIYSGGFQVFSLSDLRKITDAGVLFRSHLNGDAHMFTPESTVDAQLAFGSDIAMVLDECPEYPVSHEYARQSMHRTVRWARQAKEHFDRREGQATSALFPIVQGSMFPDLRRDCAQQLLELDAAGYA